VVGPCSFRPLYPFPVLFYLLKHLNPYPLIFTTMRRRIKTLWRRVLGQVHGNASSTKPSQPPTLEANATNPPHTSLLQNTIHKEHPDLRADRHRTGADGSGQHEQAAEGNVPKSLKGVLDLRDTTDVDQTTCEAPGNFPQKLSKGSKQLTSIFTAVTHETIRPHVHEIQEEHIYRDIHNHDVYHRILPVYDVEILPAHHFVPGPDGGLIRVSEGDLPDYTGEKEKRYVGTGSPSTTATSPSGSHHDLAHVQHKDEQKHMTIGGFEHVETTATHAPTLHDIRVHDGSDWTINFDAYGQGETTVRERSNETKAVETRPSLDLSRSGIPTRLMTNGIGIAY
jgi:hypothetical protein